MPRQVDSQDYSSPSSRFKLMRWEDIRRSRTPTVHVGPGAPAHAFAQVDIYGISYFPILPSPVETRSFHAPVLHDQDILFLDEKPVSCGLHQQDDELLEC